MTFKLAPAATLCLAMACAPESGPNAQSPEQRAMAAERQADGTCQAREDVPAIYEQVPGQVQVVQAERAADGTVIRAPIYRNATVPKVVRPRGELRFAAPCPETMTTEFISPLQRALLARGYYTDRITGRKDTNTVAAVRRYQSDNGLESGHLSLETARALGIVAVALPES